MSGRPGLAPVFLALLAALTALAPPAAAQHLGVGSLGLRGGVATDPDQAVFGFAFDLGEVAPRVRLQPSLDFATGSDGFETLSLLAPVHYRFPPSGAFQPYAGGGFEFAYVDFGRRHRTGDRTEIDIAPMVVGGVDLPLGRGTGLQRLSLELELSGGDAYDARLVFGVMF